MKTTAPSNPTSGQKIALFASLLLFFIAAAWISIGFMFSSNSLSTSSRHRSEKNCLSNSPSSPSSSSSSNVSTDWFPPFHECRPTVVDAGSSSSRCISKGYEGDGIAVEHPSPSSSSYSYTEDGFRNCAGNRVHIVRGRTNTIRIVVDAATGMVKRTEHKVESNPEGKTNTIVITVRE